MKTCEMVQEFKFSGRQTRSGSVVISKVYFFLFVEDNSLIGRRFLLKVGYMSFVTNFKVAINRPTF